MDLHSLPTPCLLLDVERVRRNAERIGRRVRDLGARLRPHIKTHKCIEVAQIQTAGHSGAITASTLAEARVFAAHGFTDITYAVPIEPGKFEAALEIAKYCERFGVITDDPEIPTALNASAQKAATKLEVFLKVDCGYHRCGVEPENPKAIGIARRIQESSHLVFAGILTHAGHSYQYRTQEERFTIARHERDVMIEFAGKLKRDGIPVPVISIGSTPTVTIIDHLHGIDEVRPGNYIFFDAFQAAISSCTPSDCALTVLAAVVHRDGQRSKIVLDAGAIALSKDRGPVDFDAACGYGRILDLEGNDLGLSLNAISQEHGEVVVGDVRLGLLDRLKVGTRVRIIPNHSCLTAAQHSQYQVLEGERIVAQWAIHRGW